MEKKEPYATQEEFDRRVIRYRDIPPVELSSGAKSHIVSAGKITVSFVSLELEPDIHPPTHHHDEHEQIFIITDGACDFIIDGKIYPLEKGDVVILPPNTEHGAYSSDKGVRAIDVFSPPRQDFVDKLEEVKKLQKEGYR